MQIKGPFSSTKEGEDDSHVIERFSMGSTVMALIIAVDVHSEILYLSFLNR